MKLSKKKARELIREEKQSSKMYKRYGFKKLSKQESNHAKFLKRFLK